MPRIATIDRDKCTNVRCRYVCKNVCPIVRIGQDAVVVGEDEFPVIDENLCSGCAICVKKCPTSAIKVINLVEEAGELFYQYGINSFRLYNLPLPKRGVVGFVGENGIGKTTAISILAGKILPNFGDYDKSYNFEEMAEIFRGREEGNYFQALGNMKIEYKIQNIESMRSDVSVRAFLGVSKKFEEVVNELGLQACIKKKMSELSGGELQMTALASMLMQDADFYYIDEPCSFLDVRQRLRTAHIIAKLSERAFVVVVEHDLAILDYLTDYVYVFYGEKGAYGVVSGIKSSRVGINDYLDGYLKEENIRIRKEQIKFDLRGTSEQIPGQVFFSYGEMEKYYTSFSLQANPGEVHENEIIGILGPNATGKTTFIKLLAGIEKPEKGGIRTNLKISYKPQYVTPEKGKVSEIIEKYKLEEGFEELKKFFEIDEILEKDCQKLSGGELQRFAIALCLGQSADIYLLDEPSAFLDIEQRLSLSNILRRKIKDGRIAFVVDHDIVLIDSLSDRIIVFDGISGVRGMASKPKQKREAMNEFLRKMDITLRRDRETKRPRINKFDSVLDRKQKEEGEYYYVW